jgi:hypothetical protein
MEKTSDCYGTLYSGIAMNIKTSDYYGTHTGCCNEWKKPTTIMRSYYNEWKKLATIMGSYMRVLQCMYKTSGY